MMPIAAFRVESLPFKAPPPEINAAVDLAKKQLSARVAMECRQLQVTQRELPSCPVHHHAEATPLGGVNGYVQYWWVCRPEGATLVSEPTPAEQLKQMTADLSAAMAVSFDDAARALAYAMPLPRVAMEPAGSIPVHNARASFATPTPALTIEEMNAIECAIEWAAEWVIPRPSGESFDNNIPQWPVVVLREVWSGGVVIGCNVDVRCNSGSAWRFVRSGKDRRYLYHNDLRLDLRDGQIGRVTRCECGCGENLMADAHGNLICPDAPHK
jgi:hypothetical protein